MGPRSIAARQAMAHVRSVGRDSLPAPMATSTSAANEKTTTSTVTARCSAFCGWDAGALLTHGKRSYPTLHTYSMAAKANMPAFSDRALQPEAPTQTAMMQTSPQGPNSAFS